MVSVEDWRRRHAIQIAAQLPEKPEDALVVLDLCRELVEGFLAPQRPPEALVRAVLPFAGSNSLNRGAKSTDSPPDAP